MVRDLGLGRRTRISPTGRYVPRRIGKRLPTADWLVACRFRSPTVEDDSIPLRSAQTSTAFYCVCSSYSSSVTISCLKIADVGLFSFWSCRESLVCFVCSNFYLTTFARATTAPAKCSTSITRKHYRLHDDTQY